MDAQEGSSEFQKVCCYCNKSCSGAHHCRLCSKPCHAIPLCSFSIEGEEGFGAKVTCSDCWLNDDTPVDQNANSDTSKEVDDALSQFINNQIVIEDNSQIVTEDNNEATSSQITRKRRGYTIEEKLGIMDFAKKSSIHAASRHFKVGRNNIRDWKKHETSLRQMIESAKRKRLAGGGRNLTDADFDRKLANWVRELRERRLRVTRNMIFAQAHQLSANNAKLNGFSASNGWLDKFLYRYKFVLRRPTTVAQRAPKAYTDAITSFILYVQDLLHSNNYSHVYACDETSVWLDPSGGTCVAEKGSKTVTVLNTGHEKARVTVLLTGRSDGAKMKPFVLLPKKRPVPDIVKRFDNKLVLSWCGRTWIDNELTTEYLEKVFGNFFFGRRLLIWDSFRCHISQNTKQTLRRLKIHSAVVPGGTTKYIQAPDVCWNAPFKNFIRNLYNDWMVHGDKPTTPAGNLKSPPMEVYLDWIVSAWDSIPKTLIADSFLTCGITKETDGRHDEKIHVFKTDGAIPNGLALLQLRSHEEAVVRGVEEIDLGEDESDVSIGI